MNEYNAAYFYSVEPVFKAVGREEFDAFIKSYPRELERDRTGIGEPPLVSYNDFALANRWPHSIVAMYSDYAADPDYRICTNFEAVYASKTGKMA